ncbi:N-terminal Xaa-Pro-Lys N-methyltransferase 1-like [Tubulanus polymorphus]|uniref:N-terminal Xaa-Pro-Lys N-methyltransferase 1-like n=1 Tax=Tubulanus polymorphus TaxID=672921 RepID=UPI003DA453B6
MMRPVNTNIDEDSTQRPKFYTDAEKYWGSVPSTVNGMLGGFSHISPTDINGSRDFIIPFLEKDSQTGTGKKRALDCGAGIGRITKRLLLPIFDEVDMVEVNPNFIEEAKTFLGDEAKRVGNFFCSGLQNFTPEKGRYDVIWIQWVIGHLTDKDFVDFLNRCVEGLTQNGLIVVKDNLSSTELLFDEQDSSYTRTQQQLEAVFESAGFRILKNEKQKNFPTGLYAVRTYALQK